MKRTFALVLAGVLLALLIPAGVSANAKHDTTLDNYAPSGHKAYVCHRVAGQGQSKNGYNFITVDEHSLDTHLGDERSGPANQHPPKKGRQDFVPNAWQIANRTCADRPPVIQRFNPKLVVRVCGDPRLILTINNRRSTVPVTYYFSFVRARDGERVYKRKTVGAGERDVLYPFWVKGRSLLIIHNVSAPGFFTPAVNENIRLPRATPWGRGTCPASLSAAISLARNY